MRDLFVFQSQQARLATLYLPLFGLLQENVNRLNVKEVSPFPINPSNNVRVPPSGFFLIFYLPYIAFIHVTNKEKHQNTTQPHLLTSVRIHIVIKNKIQHTKRRSKVKKRGREKGAAAFDYKLLNDNISLIQTWAHTEMTM